MGAAGRPLQSILQNRLLWFWLLAALVLVGGAGLRLAAWQEARGYAPRGDELDYVIPAETLTRTGRYVDTFISDGRTWTRVPGNSLLLAAAFATQPPVPATVTITDTAWMAPRLAAGNLAEIAVSLALLPLVMGLAAAAFPARRRRVALLAGALAAAYPPFIFSAAQTLLSETLFMTLICAALLALVRWAPRRAAWPWLVIAGGLLGLAALTRSAAVAFLPFLPFSVDFGFWILDFGFWRRVGFWKRAGQGRLRAPAGKSVETSAPPPPGHAPTQNPQPKIRNPKSATQNPQPKIQNPKSALLILGLVVLATITPWTVYNYRMYGRVMLLDTANLTAFWHYNNFSGGDETARLAALPNPADRQALTLREGLANIAAYPGRFAQNVSNSLGYAWHLELQSALKPNAWDLTRRDADVPAVVPTDAAFLALAFAGLAGWAALGWRGGAARGGRARRLLALWVACMLLLGAVIPYDARYRMPAAPALIVFAAGLLVSVQWRLVMRPRGWAAILRARPGVTAVVAALCAWVVLGAASPRLPAAIRALGLAWQADHAAPALAGPAPAAAALRALPGSFWPYRVAAGAAHAAGDDAGVRALYAGALARGDDPRSVLGLADLAARHPEWRLTPAEADLLQADPAGLRGAPWNSFTPAPLTRLVLGTDRDWGYVQGFQASEQTNGVPFRWSSGRADLRLPAPPGAPPAAALRLRLAAPVVGPPGAWAVEVRVDGAAPVTLAVGPAWTDYRVPLGPAVAGDLRIHLAGPAYRPSDLTPAARDRRLLGVGVQWVERAP